MSASSSLSISSTPVNIGDPGPSAPYSIKELENGLHPKSSNRASIYRVPPIIRQVNEKAFTPQMVSIGPFHHGKAEFQQWEDNKIHYCRAFHRRTGKSPSDSFEVVKKLEEEVRKSYSDKIDMDSDAFVKMVLVDSSFIIEVICRRNKKYPAVQDDYLSNLDLIFLVQRDMLLLENQIPFFVLRDLFSFGHGKDEFLDLSLDYFAFVLLTITEPGDNRDSGNEKHKQSSSEVKHFTDLLRICHLPEELKEKKKNGNKFVRIPNAARFHEAGMKFQIGTDKCLLDMKYNKGFLEMPKFRVQDHSECLLRNLIALETCHHHFDSYIIDYILFMDMLIDNATDVDLLVQKGIITHNLSNSDAVASLFNNLAMETTLFGPYYFTSISNDMNEYYKVPWHNWKATFKRDYCSTPWMIASTVAAIMLLVLTLIQTIFSIISALN